MKPGEPSLAGTATLRCVGEIQLPEHRGSGGFDHAAVDPGRGLLLVAHTANDAVDVIDMHAGRYLRSIEGLAGVAGTLIHETTGALFTSNRGENTVGLFRLGSDGTKVEVGIRPNGLAYDPGRSLLLSANIGDQFADGPPSVTLVDTASTRALMTLPMPGRTRWAVFDPRRQVFFVNLMDPSTIAVIDPVRLAKTESIDIDARGPHGLELDPVRRRLYCACDDGSLIALDADSGAVVGRLELSGAPDVVLLNPERSLLYVAIGEPGLLDVIDIAGWRRVEAVPTERGAHTLALDASAGRVYAFCRASHCARVFTEG
jgi:DNA-binding beta-propeller fold protein YncE